ncbi:MAG: RagB/SusD family nutrient uptake outer membrane protein [Candidatus Azobacteroides sp.]|nr:RagB/SusD family nutrient uptake outer membrane protein [Candidatus Azobacteroides sp.]
MKNIFKIYQTIGLMGVLVLGAASCEDFLDRPAEDNYTVDNFYETDDQCYQAVNPLYNSPWYDVQRFFIQAGEVLSGNYYYSCDYLTFTVNSTNDALNLCSASLWSVNAYANGIIENIDMKAGSNVSESVKNTVKGEALVWKAMAYFFLVRTFGEVPIIHKNSDDIAANTYNDKYKATKENVYDYIIKTLEKAAEWLPEQNKGGRIDRYSAYGLLAKVYLAKAGVTGTLNQTDLNNAATYAKEVIDKSGRHLLPVYSDLFRPQNNINEEALISWAWKAGRDPWTQQNSLQCDLSMTGFSEFNDNWGTWMGPTIDLQNAFSESALSKTRNNRDARRKATMMMYSDHYDYFWTDKGGFDWNYLALQIDGNLNGVGANCVKFLVGDAYDHQQAGIGAMDNMANGLFTHLLRLADVYLIYAEAKVLLNQVDASVLNAFNQVRLRSFPNDTPRTSLSWQDVWKERRLELAGEGDRWYDYVRWHYYAPDQAIAEIKAQKRSTYTGLKDFYTSSSTTPDPSVTYYDKNPTIPNVMDQSFTLPFPEADVSMNQHLTEPAQDIDISQFAY